MGDGIEEAVLLFVSPNFADQKDRVHDQTRDQQSEENNSEDERDNLPPVENNPANVQGDRQGHKADPEHDKEDDGFGAARDAHDDLVYDRDGRVPQVLRQFGATISSHAVRAEPVRGQV